MIYANNSLGAIDAMERERTGNWGEDEYDCETDDFDALDFDDEDLIYSNFIRRKEALR